MTANPLDAALHAVYTLIELGQPPNGVGADDCGPYAETVDMLQTAYASGDDHNEGIAAARQVWDSILRLNVASDLPLIDMMRQATTMSRPRVIGRSALSAPTMASGLWA